MGYTRRRCLLPLPAGLGETMNILQPENPISTTVSRPRKPRPLRVPALKSSTKDGKRYKRFAHNEGQITEMVSHPPSVWLEKAPDLRNETLVFLIRRTHGFNDIVCGGLMEELQERIKACAGRYTQSLDDVDEETVLLNVEIRILERVILKTKTGSRKQEYLEVAFGQEIQRVTLAEIKKLKRTPSGLVDDFCETDDEGRTVKRPIEYLLDDGPGPVDRLLNLDATNVRHQLLRKACEAVPDRDQLHSIVLHYAHEVPITTKERGKNSLVKLFRKKPRKIKYWLETGMAQMRAALGVKKPRRGRKPSK
jgi:hypothetical protein